MENRIDTFRQGMTSATKCHEHDNAWMRWRGPRSQGLSDLFLAARPWPGSAGARTWDEDG